ncbi:MAG: hypothetical protein KGI51_15395, partial [Rhodospirillales bacterium]|nr:hypothetical protein [Rhodospirillales bacterium]
MTAMTRRFRLLAALAFVMLAAPALPAFAQDGPGGPFVTPPARVGRMGWTRGTVSFRPSGSNEWVRAVRNYPVSAGDAVWTQPGTSAGVQLGAATIDLGPGTELDLDRLDPSGAAATLPQGEVVLRIGRLLPGETYTFETPRGTATVTAPGEYEIAAGSTEAPTLITAFRGAASVSGPANLDLRGGQTAMITGTQEFEARVTPAMHDAFATAMLRPRPVRRYAVAPPPMVAEMPGGDDLDEYGVWEPSPDYGPVWYPRVASGWVPYREGHWAYVAPWGWTWIDDDPWGFAPFHYGRWVEIGPRWAWVPGPVVVAEAPSYPVYAPALVAFFGVGGGIAASLSFGALVGGSVGWVPLAPFEAYHPCFRASPAYVREVNIRQVTNVTNITNVTVNQVTINRFRNQRGATVVPAAALVSSRAVAPLARPGGARILATSARPILGRPPVAPAATTAGVTPSLARRQGIAPIAPAVVRQLPRNLTPLPRPVATGPALRPQAAAQLPRPGVAPGGPIPAGRPAPGPVGGPQSGIRPIAPAAVRPPLVGPGGAPIGAARPSTPAARPPGPIVPAPGAQMPGRPIQGGPTPLPTLRAPG